DVACRLGDGIGVREQGRHGGLPLRAGQHAVQSTLRALRITHYSALFGDWSVMSSTTPKYNPKLVGLGLLAGAALGIAWVNTRQRQHARHGAPSLIDWGRAGSIARQIIKEDAAAP